MHTDQRYILYLKENNPLGIREIYERYAGQVKRFIVKNSGDADDAADIFQEALIDIYHLAQKPTFTLTCPFEPFLITICRNKWFNVLKKRKGQPVTNTLDDVYTFKQADLGDMDSYLDEVAREQAVMQTLEELGERCKEIIKACMSDTPQDQVAATLGLTYAYLRKKKSECMQTLGKMVKAHPLFSNQTPT